ncbi:hypothetical protein SEUCBS139899_010658 [Sporothrix eucalyptigena]
MARLVRADQGRVNNDNNDGDNARDAAVVQAALDKLTEALRDHGASLETTFVRGVVRQIVAVVKQTRATGEAGVSLSWAGRDEGDEGEKGDDDDKDDESGDNRDNRDNRDRDRDSSDSEEAPIERDQIVRLGDLRRRRRDDSASNTDEDADDDGRPAKRARARPKVVRLLDEEPWQATQTVAALQSMQGHADDQRQDGSTMHPDDRVRHGQEVETFCRTIVEATFRGGHVGVVDALLQESLQHQGRVDVGGEVLAVTQRMAAAASAAGAYEDALTAFAADWGKAFYIDRQARCASNRVRLLAHKVRVYRQWEALTSAQGAARERLLARLEASGEERRRGITDRTRLVRYMTRTFQLKDTKTFSNSMYAWRPLADFEGCFGQGVFALLPRGIEKKAAALARPFRGVHDHGPGGDEGRLGDQGRSLPWLLEELKRRKPTLQVLCDAADRMLIGPLLATGQIADTRGAELYREGRGKEARGMPLLQRLGPPHGLGGTTSNERPVGRAVSLALVGPPYQFDAVASCTADGDSIEEAEASEAEASESDSVDEDTAADLMTVLDQVEASYEEDSLCNGRRVRRVHGGQREQRGQRGQRVSQSGGQRG